MKKIYFSILLVFAMLCTNVCYAGEAEKENVYYYVSVNGSDENSGTADKPFATVEKARDTIRELKKEKGLPNGSITVYIRDGVYRLDSTLKFNSEDSGSESCTIRYCAYPGENPVITTGYYIGKDSFSNVKDKEILARLSKNAKKNALTVNLKELGITEYGELSQSGDGIKEDEDVYGMGVYVGERAYDLARWPNKDSEQKSQYVKTEKVLINQSAMEKNSQKIAKFTVSQDIIDRMKTWKTYKNVWTEGSFNWVYACASFPIDTVDWNTRAISVRGSQGGGFAANKPFYFMNCLEELDCPGEYYIDRDNGILYIYPDEEFENNEYVKLSENRGMYIIALEDGANYIDINGITFELSQKHGGLVNKCSNVTVSECKFINCAGMGLFVADPHGSAHATERHSQGLANNNVELDTHDVSVISCEFHNTGFGGVRVAGGDSYSLTPANHKVYNNHASKTDILNHTYAPGISVFGCNIDMSNNLIENLAHAGCNFAGSELLIEGNEVRNVLREYSDMGAFYTATSNFTNVLKNNHIHDIPIVFQPNVGTGEFHGMIETGKYCEFRVGIYYDGSLSGGTAYNNIIEDCTFGIRHTSWGGEFKGNIFRNTWFAWSVGNGQYALTAYREGDWMSGNNCSFWRNFGTENYNVAWKEKYPEIFEMRAQIDKNIAEKGEEFNNTNDILEENVYLYDDPEMLEDYYDRYIFDDINMFNQFKTRPSTSWMTSTATTTISVLEKSGGSYKNNIFSTNDIGFVDYENGNFDIKEDAEILETMPTLSGIRTQEIGLVDDNLDKRIASSTVFLANSPTACVDGKEVLIDKTNVENICVEKNGEYYIPAKFAVEELGIKKDLLTTDAVSLSKVAELLNTNITVYENGLIVLGNEELFRKDYKYDQILMTVLCERMK